jgi:hypothetical protein
MEAMRWWWAYAVLALLGCTRSEAQDQLPQRVGPVVPVARAIDSAHRNVCYVFPDGSGDCEKF